MQEKSKEIFIAREIYPEILNWLNEPEIIAISGPRQSGKTTLLRKLADDLNGEEVVFVNFEDSEQLEAFQRSPQTFVDLQIKKDKKTFFLFDEFQYVKNAGKILKLLFDQYPNVKFIITGSSSLKIRQIASFLVGRVIFFPLYPLSFAEYLSGHDRTLFNLWQKINQAFSDFLDGKKCELPEVIYEKKLQKVYEDYLTFGGYPAVATSIVNHKVGRLQSLIETYIEKDVVKYLQIGNFLEFKALTRILSAQIGGIIRYSSLSQDTALSFAEVKKFLGALEQTFVIKLLSPYHQNKITELKKSPKVYFLDLGLRNALIADFRNLPIRPDKGALVENCVAQNLLFRKKTSELYFWRTKQQAEVDFVVRMQNETIPMEIKYQSFTKPGVPRGLTSFINNYSPQKAVVLTKDYLGLSKFSNQKGRILFLPVYFV